MYCAETGGLDMADKGTESKVLAFVVYPGTAPLDLVASWQFMSALAMKGGYELVVVAETLQPVETDTPLTIIPDKTFAEVSRPYGLLVMGSGGKMPQAIASEALLSYVGTAGNSAELVASIGTGSLILAAAGLLQGRQATTHWSQRGALEELGSHYLRQRWVEEGKFLTAAGDTAGIDMSLHLLSKLSDQATVRFSQLWAEYDPQPPFGGINWSEVNDKLPRASPSTTKAADRKQIAFVLYPGLTVFDLVGPLQVLSRLANLAPQFETVVVAEQMEPVVSDSRLAFWPSKTFADIPQPYAVIVPGGSMPTLRAMNHPAIRHYIRTAASSAAIVGSVCTGALLLAAVGLLDGREVPTHWAYKSVLESN
jgi:transcriptional regulator GlxA family with amidase domain